MNMTDLEITRLCASAMGHHQRKISDGGARTWVIPHHPDPQCAPSAIIYDPLHDDAQAMALVKKFNLSIDSGTWSPEACWRVSFLNERPVEDDDLNRAICECVAKMQAVK